MNTGASVSVLLLTLPFALGNHNVVFPRLVEGRSLNEELILHITDGVTLKLKKSSVAAPQVRVVSFNNGEEVTKIYDGNEIQESIYHDADQLAAVSLVRSNGAVEVEGVLGPYQRIKPVYSERRSEDGQIAHVIYKIEQTNLFDVPLPPSNIVTRNEVLGRKANMAGSTVPDFVLVEIFFILDSYHHKIFKNESLLLRYLCIMVATVNIRLEETSSPQVQLAITGIERSEREKYISEYGYQISSSATLASLRNYAHWKKAHFRYPDIVFLLTGRDAYILTDGKKDTSVGGQAYLCGVCTTEYVGLAEDKPGTYSGMHTFAHEVGHLLGASHDGSGIDTKDFKRPDSRDCFYREGYLMSYVDRGPQKYHFSNRSLKQIQYTMSRAGLWCWRTSYWRLINGTGEYPGMTMSLTEYCKKLFPTDYHVHVVDASTTLKKCKVQCKFMRYSRVFRHGRWTSSFESYEAVRDALEYTPCKENTTKVCIQGKCLGKRARRLQLKQHDTKKE